VTFDVVVVGAGSAGCAVAGALGADSRRSICLVEAGPDYGAHYSGRWPAELLDPRQRPRTHDWTYMAEGATGIVPESRAKVVGGCSSHNQCAIVRPAPEDCESWGWKAGDLAAVAREVGRYVPMTPYADEDLAFWQRAFLEAAVAAGVGRVPDVGDPGGSDGVAPFHANVRDGVRWNAAFAFLDAVRGQPNVTVLSNALVDQLEIEGDRALAVSCIQDGRRFEIAARRFVLSAGTYGSPGILLRSGVGPKRDLEVLGIPVRVARAGVGQNLHDHPGIALEYEPSAMARATLVTELAERRLYQSQIILRARSSHAGSRADLHLAPYQAPAESGNWSFDLLVFNLAPRSRGHVTLRDRDPHLPPRIELRLLTDPNDRDVAVLVEGVRLARRVAREAPLARAIARELVPGASVDNAAAARKVIRSRVTDYAHPVGTCAAGPADDPSAVVGADGRVHGLDNVFVADASIMRSIPRANTNFACFLIGWHSGRALAATSA
jgi:choline dehydrogenase